jgi:hypothetical protein
MFSSPSVARRLVAQSTRRSHRSASIKLNPVSEHDLAHFSEILPSTSVLSVLPPNSISPSELSPYNDDWMGKYHGHATTVLRPHTTQQVSHIVKWCWERRIGVVPQGGNTGLVGGSVPLHDEVIVSLGNMSKVRSFDPISGQRASGFWPRHHSKLLMSQVSWLRMLGAFYSLLRTMWHLIIISCLLT